MSAVPYTFANASGQVPASQLDVNFANVKAAVDTAGIVTTNAQPNITSVGTLTALNVTGNVISGNVLTIGRVSATGNITGNYFIGNGSQLTGIVATSTYGNANVANLLSEFGSNTISTTGNITANYFIGNGSQLTGLAATYSNANVATFLDNFGSNTISTTGNVAVGNITSNGLANINSLRVNQTANAWVIAGNTIYAPSGATWNSNAISKDEYITSAVDGYINLTSRYANSNTASQVHLEHGLAQIITDEYIWAFNNTGNLTLPGNTFAVNYANGNPVIINSSSYGNADVATFLAAFGSNTISTTGNITSNGLANVNSLRVNQTANAWVIAGNVITAPSGATWNSNAISKDEYITSAVDGYINLTSLYANSSTASQVHLEHGLAQIVVNNGSEYIWAFDDAGNLTAPGNVSAVGNITGGNITTAGQVSATGNITSNGLANINSLRVNQTANAWVIAGNVITAPSGAVWNSNAISKDEYITSAVDGYINLTSRYANSNTASQVHLEHGLAQIVVNNGSEYIWAFDDAGDLSAPGNVSATGNITGGNLTTSGQVSATANITGNNLVASGLISAVGNITGANLNVGSGNVNVGNLVFALDSSKFNSAKWTLIETVDANLTFGNQAVSTVNSFNYYSTNYNEILCLSSSGSANGEGETIVIPVQAVTANSVWNINQQIGFKWANLSNANVTVVSIGGGPYTAVSFTIYAR